MKRIIGIDLGTTNSAAAFMDGDEPKLIPNERGSRITPSVVAFSPEGEILVGESAKNQAVINAEGTVTAAKRSMGTGKVYNIGGKKYTPQQISAYILSKLKKDAETYLGESVEDAVITVPAYFSEPQRRATAEAGRLAGFNVRRILNEPTAAALAYAHRMNEDKRILVYDLGGGTFDVTCLIKEGKRFIVKATGGDAHLGGMDFNWLLINRVIDYFQSKSNIPIKDDSVLLQQLYDQVERAKKELSTGNSATIALPFITGTGKPIHLTYTISRTDFNQIIDSLVKRTIKRTQRAVADAGFGIAGIDYLVLSGGSSRIPLVRTYLDRSLNPQQATQVNPDEIVAMGAAVQGLLLEESGADINEDIILKDITSHSLGVEIEGDNFVPIIQRNSQIPARAEKIFTTVENNQTSVEIHVLQGQSEIASNNQSLGRFLLSGVREGEKGQPRIRVAFTIDADGLADISASDMDTGVKQRIRVTPLICPDSSGAGSSGRAGENRLRLQCLLDRLSRLKEYVNPSTEADFMNEINELISMSEEAMDRNIPESLRECQIALETLIGELETVLGSGEAEYGGA